MPRAFELRSQEGGGDLDAIIDLDKVCLIRVERGPGRAYENITVRFVDGHEARDIVPRHAAEEFLNAYRSYLQDG
jgi:hypothetical protein